MILMYHKIDIITPTEWWVSRARFAEHMEALKKLDVVYLEDYEGANSLQCVITFDDSYENVYRHAFPILKKYGYPFEIFVNGNYFGKWNTFDLEREPATRMCTLDQLAEMARGGGRIQWHTADHINLPSVPVEKAIHQMIVPYGLRIAFPPPHLLWFSYPWGEFTPQLAEVAKSLFQGAVAVDKGSETDRHELPRMIAHEDLDIFALVKETREKTSKESQTGLKSGSYPSKKFENNPLSASAAFTLHKMVGKSISRFQNLKQRYEELNRSNKETKGPQTHTLKLKNDLISSSILKLVTKLRIFRYFSKFLQIKKTFWSKALIRNSVSSRGAEALSSANNKLFLAHLNKLLKTKTYDVLISELDDPKNKDYAIPDAFRIRAYRRADMRKEAVALAEKIYNSSDKKDSELTTEYLWSLVSIGEMRKALSIAVDFAKETEIKNQSMAFIHVLLRILYSNGNMKDILARTSEYLNFGKTSSVLHAYRAAAAFKEQDLDLYVGSIKCFELEKIPKAHFALKKNLFLYHVTELLKSKKFVELITELDDPRNEKYSIPATFRIRALSDVSNHRTDLGD